MAGGPTTGRGDTITLRLPPNEDLVAVAMLVVGGLAARLNLTVENLEDLDLAVESLLGHVRKGEDTTLLVEVGRDALTASVGPVDAAAVRAELDETAEGIGLGRLLQTVADGHRLVERDGNAWLSIEKRVPGTNEPE